MIKRIGWIDGGWGTLESLKISLNDRGLNYADGIFETILIWNGEAKLLSSHYQRWKNSASNLGMALPPTKDELLPLIKEGIRKCSLEKDPGCLRINWSRGQNENRGINISNKHSNPSNHRFWLEFNAVSPNFKPISTVICCSETRNPNSNLSMHKTFAYGQAIQARRESKNAGYDDALLASIFGEICCGTTSNLIIKRGNKYLTPRLQSGCLPGIMRQQGLDKNILEEAKIEITPKKNDEWLLINSLNCQPIYQINNTRLNIFSQPEELWLSLYDIKVSNPLKR